MPRAAALLAAVLLAAPAAAAPTFEQLARDPSRAVSAVPPGFHAFPQAGPLSPPDMIFVPSHPRALAPLVVALHGCEQDAAGFAALTRWNALAERDGFYVLYPSQQSGRNGFNCWNWFLPVDQVAGLGETAEVAAAVRAAEDALPVDPRRVFVAGLSSGGSLAADLLACEPGLFAAGAVHSGVSIGLAEDAVAAFAVMKYGPLTGLRAPGVCDPSAFRGDLLVVQGRADAAVNPVNADRLVADFVPAGAKRVVTAVPASGGRRSYTIRDFAAPGSRRRVREVLVDGLGHRWSGGTGKLGDPAGPDAAELMRAFFAR
jgi:poly(hydroxyalkanoate) depolymerase family esterase